MSRFSVGGKVVERVDLLRKKHWAWRLDVWPFAILYAVWPTSIVPSIDIGDALIVFGAFVALHILVLLFTAWSVDFKCFVQYSKANDIHQADACKITPAKFSGSKEIVPLHFRKQLAGSSSPSDAEEIYFDFRKQCFIYSKEKQMFSKLSYPTKETFGYHLKNTGHGTEAKVASAIDKWGQNVFDYPKPTFQKLLKEHCVEPFFVFQVFCVGLWCLDEYWFYSFFTLFMLFMFESTKAKSRLKTLTELRRVRVDNQTLMVHRCGKWVKLSGTDLLPGDVVSVRRSSGLNGEDKSVPADMLLLAGSAIVNEAILTGESTPQWKAHVGVALLNAVPLTPTGNSSETSKNESDKSVKSKKPKPPIEAAGKSTGPNAEGSSRGRVAPRSGSTNNSAGNCHSTNVELQQQKLKKLMEEMNEGGDGRAPVKLGDASMASPFTAKHA